MKLLKKNKEDFNELMLLLDCNCTIETRGGLHLVITPSGDIKCKVSEILHQFLLDNEIIEVL